MIKVNNSNSQSIDVGSIVSNQTIVVKNIQDQNIGVSEKNESLEIQIENADQPQKIIISTGGSGGAGGSCSCDLESRVPKALSILPQAQISQFNTTAKRHTSRIYVDVDGKASYADLEQIKQLNTKIICVDTLNDNKIYSLSNEDIILLRKG